MAGGSNEEGEFGLQIAPMLDILFVLLLFFMVSAGIQKKEGNIKTPIPGGGTGPESTVPMKIGIDAVGTVTFNSVPVDKNHKGHELPQLEARLRGVLKTNTEIPIIITPSYSTTHQNVMDVLNACKGANVKKIALSTPSS